MMDSAAVSHGVPMDSKVSRNYIHDDLAFSILSKLPIKSLKRFGCVRKSWSILFENCDFMSMYRNHFISHHHRNSDDHHTFVLIHHLELPVTPDYRYHVEVRLLENRIKLNLPSPFEEDDGNLSILCSASVNGVFCIGQGEVNMNKARYVLWNPATKEFVVVPPSPDELVSQQHPNVSVSHNFHGFGYDQLRNDFKVIQHVSFDYERSVHYSRQPKFFEIYSSKTNSWRTLDVDMPQWYHDYAFTGKEVYMDGACHWLGFGFGYNDKKCIVSFDLSHEVFFITPIVENLGFECIYKHLAVLNGFIALISNHDDDDLMYHISILGQLGVKESWIKLFNFSTTPAIDSPPYPIGVGKMGDIFFRKKDDELVSIDLTTQRIEEVGVKGDQSCCKIGIYKKSDRRISN